MTVDPKVREVAAAFVGDLFLELTDAQYERLCRERTVTVRTLVDRAAQAMQRAIEDECAAIRQELTT